MPRLREKQKLEVRKSLLDHGLDLIRRQGLVPTTVEEITRAAGVAKGTFFNHFPSKESLLYDFIQRETDQIMKEAMDFHPGQARAALRSIGAALARFGMENQRLLLDLGSFKGSLRESERDHDDRIRGRLVRLIEEDESVDPAWCRAMAARFVGLVLAAMSGTVHEWRLSAGEADLGTLLGDRIDMLLLLLPAGRAERAKPGGETR